MSVKKILKEADIVLEPKEFSRLMGETKQFIESLKRHIAINKIDADVFLGGSFAKGTVARSEEYDADIFVRFDWKYEELSDRLEKILKGVVKEGGFNMLRLHGSRDYFKIYKTRYFAFEVIPVTRIKKPQQASNVTDLSYFHVKYVKSHMKKNTGREIALAKKFFKSAGVYGAESYIHGFSGYGVECLLLNYGSFEKMLRELVKVKLGERLILDPAKHYKKKDNVLFELNESKLKSPVILVDPTWKERNVLASLSWESFSRFQSRAREFLRTPSLKFFEKSENRERGLMSLAKKKKAEYAEIVLKTNRQEGDIAGTKMKKFSKYLTQELGKYFEMLGEEFSYPGEGQEARLSVVARSRGEVTRIGPPLHMNKEAAKFERANRGRTFKKNGQLYARERVDFSLKKFLQRMSMKENKKLEEMGISEMKIV
jgi:tRNA nucleotidyltransferase (CCA-adding enzyme)